MAKWPLDGKQACFCSFCLVCSSYGGWQLCPAPQQRHCAMGSPAQACVPGCRIAALQHCVMVDA
jgi:hypothetical protein